MESSDRPAARENDRVLHQVKRYGVGVGAILALGGAYYVLALGPIHGVGSAAECADAYAKAKTHQDSLSIDLMSVPDSTGHGMNTRCGWLRADQVQSASALTPKTHD